MVLKSRPVVTMAGVSLPLLILLFLASPVVIPNFSVMQHLVWGKLVQYWGNLKYGGRKCMSFLDFCFSSPVIQLPIFVLGGGSATALLMQHSIKFISKTFGNLIIFDGTHYLSLYLYIILIKLLGTKFIPIYEENQRETIWAKIPKKSLGIYSIRFCIYVGIYVNINI